MIVHIAFGPRYDPFRFVAAFNFYRTAILCHYYYEGVGTCKMLNRRTRNRKPQTIQTFKKERG